jgi:hypothetical protein
MESDGEPLHWHRKTTKKGKWNKKKPNIWWIQKKELSLHTY